VEQRNKWLIRILGLLVLFILLVFLVQLYTDWLWFNSVGYRTVFATKFWTQVFLGVVGAALFFGLFFPNVRLARGVRARLDLVSEKTLLSPEERETMESVIHPALLVVTILFSLVAGLTVSMRWLDWLQFLHGTSFGLQDPIFHQDLSFYVFRWPFWFWVVKVAFKAVILTTLGVALVYLYEEAIQISEEALTVAPRAKSHLLVLAAALFGLRAFFYLLSRYSILYSQRGAVTGGAGYADVYAQLPFLLPLALLCLLTAGLCLYGAGGRSTRPAFYGLGAVVLVALLGWGYPELIQRVVVMPNELEKEKNFLAWNIEFTNRAYGLDRIQTRDFAAENTLTANHLAENDLTIRNIRLWDDRPLKTTYAQMQEIRSYYDFNDVDIDRYRINGELRQVMLSARELDHLQLPPEARRWVNEHAIYTHGYGLCMSPVNQSEEGMPAWFIKDIPPQSTVDLTVTQPAIYFGEVVNRPAPQAGGSLLGGPRSSSPSPAPSATGPRPPGPARETGADYLLVQTTQEEFDYPQGETNVQTRYRGKAGVPIGSLGRKLLFAIRFRSPQILFTRFVTRASRIIFHRQINELVHTIAPFLTYDPDPYLVVHEGRLCWIIDAYTMTRWYPYSEPYQRVLNYIRNSVKIVIDAYDGTVTFYRIDETDPLVETYARIFPDLFRPLDQMPAGLRAHLRYPTGLFGIQAEKYKVYHMRDVNTFYNREDAWEFAKEPIEAPHAPRPPAPRRGPTGQPPPESQLKYMEPYYVIMRLPGETEEEFILMLPFTPRGAQDKSKDNMIAWLCAKCDPARYGEMLVFEFPKRKVVFGPQQIRARINQNDEISKAISLWSQEGSSVFLGNLLVIPIEESLLYVVPLYLQAEVGALPQLQRVIVAYGDQQVAMEPTLEEALRRIFGTATATAPPRGEPQPTVAAPPRPGPQPATEETLEALIRQVGEWLEREQQALRAGDWATVEKAGQQLRQVYQKLQTKAAQGQGNKE